MFWVWLRWACIALIGMMLIVGISPVLQRKLYERGLVADQFQYGDLYNKTNLAQFRDENFHALDRLDSTDLPSQKAKGVHLYTLGDSFTDIDTSFYAGEKNVHVWITYGSAVTRLNPDKRNILVIEVIERLLQQRMKDSTWRMYVDNALVDSASAARQPGRQSAAQPPLMASLMGYRFAPQINNRLEFLFFNNPLALRAKEIKAAILLNWFGRTPGARLSNDQQEVFYDIEVDTTSELSSFRHLSYAVIDTTVHKLNLIHDHYKKMGFDEVYISLIPNKSSVMAPKLGAYNRQIERIERHPLLKPAVLSVVDTLSAHPDWYHHGDGHWNKYGKRFWLRQVNGLTNR